MSSGCCAARRSNNSPTDSSPFAASKQRVLDYSSDCSSSGGETEELEDQETASSCSSSVSPAKAEELLLLSRWHQRSEAQVNRSLLLKKRRAATFNPVAATTSGWSYPPRQQQVLPVGCGATRVHPQLPPPVQSLYQSSSKKSLRNRGGLSSVSTNSNNDPSYSSRCSPENNSLLAPVLSPTSSSSPSTDSPTSLLPQGLLAPMSVQPSSSMANASASKTSEAHPESDDSASNCCCSGVLVPLKSRILTLQLLFLMALSVCLLLGIKMHPSKLYLIGSNLSLNTFFKEFNSLSETGFDRLVETLSRTEGANSHFLPSRTQDFFATPSLWRPSVGTLLAKDLLRDLLRANRTTSSLRACPDRHWSRYHELFSSKENEHPFRRCSDSVESNVLRSFLLELHLESTTSQLHKGASEKPFTELFTQAVYKLSRNSKVLQSLRSEGMMAAEGVYGMRFFSFGKRVPHGLEDSTLCAVKGGRQIGGRQSFFPEVNKKTLSYLESAAQKLLEESIRRLSMPNNKKSIAHQWLVLREPFGVLAINKGSQELPEFKLLKNLFTKSLGLISPQQLSYGFLRNARFLYILLFLVWAPSILSFQPVTLIHFPRFLTYCAIALYRIIVLYLLSNFIERKLHPSFDFSDSVVLYCFIGFIFSIEIAAAERSHRYVHKKVKSEEERRGFLTSTENTSAGRGKLRLPFVTRCCAKIGMKLRPFALGRKGGHHQTPLAVRFVYGYSLAMMLCVLSAAFVTALWFHEPSETLVGLCVGLFGLFVPFWLCLAAGCLPVARLTILEQ